MRNKNAKFKSMLLSILLIWPIASVGVTAAFAANDNTSVVIYHTNDMHGKINSVHKNGSLTQIGLDFVKSAKQQTENAILLDAGDATQGTPMGKYSKGAAIIQLMNEAGYDLMTLGNHEFDYGVDAVAQIAQSANFPVISANTFLNDRPFLADVNGNNGRNYIKEIGGKRIGFFGITTEETNRTTIPANLSGITFKDEIETTREQVEYLQSQGVDLIVGIMHIGIDSSSHVTSREIVQNVPGIDIVIDGHSHSNHTETLGDTLIQQVGANSVGLGRIALEFSGDTVNISEAKVLTPTEVESTFTADQNLTAMYDSMAAELAPTLEKVVGKTRTTLYGGSYNGKNVSRMVETNLGSLIADAMIHSTKQLLKGTENENLPIVALENGGAVRSKISAGYITMEDILQVLPLDNRLSLQVITPKVLYETMERGVCKQTLPTANGEPLDGFFGGYPQIGGMRLEYDATKTPYDTEHPEHGSGERVVKIVLLNEDGSDKALLDRNDTETQILFACNDYTITEYPMVSDIAVLQKGDYLSSVLADYVNKLTLENGGSFSYPLLQGRSTLLNKHDAFSSFNAEITVLEDSKELASQTLQVQVDGAQMSLQTDAQGKILLEGLSAGGHNISVVYNGNYADAYVDNMLGLTSATISLGEQAARNVKCTENIISQIPENLSQNDAQLVSFARNSYDSLPDDSKENVKNYDLLVQAENSLLALGNNNQNVTNTAQLLIIIGGAIIIILAGIVVLALKKKKSAAPED